MELADGSLRGVSTTGVAERWFERAH